MSTDSDGSVTTMVTMVTTNARLVRLPALFRTELTVCDFDHYLKHLCLFICGSVFVNVVLLARVDVGSDTPFTELQFMLSVSLARSASLARRVSYENEVNVR